MIVMSTQFQHKQIHKGTWRSPDHNIINQIDHVLVSQNEKKAIEDVGSFRMWRCVVGSVVLDILKDHSYFIFMDFLTLKIKVPHFVNYTVSHLRRLEFLAVRL